MSNEWFMWWACGEWCASSDFQLIGNVPGNCEFKVESNACRLEDVVGEWKARLWQRCACVS